MSVEDTERCQPVWLSTTPRRVFTHPTEHVGGLHGAGSTNVGRRLALRGPLRATCAGIIMGTGGGFKAQARRGNGHRCGAVYTAGNAYPGDLPPSPRSTLESVCSLPLLLEVETTLVGSPSLSPSPVGEGPRERTVDSTPNAVFRPVLYTFLIC